MTLLSALFTALLLVPALAIAALWWAARHRQARQPATLPDSATLVLARVAALVATALPALQLVAGTLRWRTGEAGLYLWYAVLAFGLLLTVLALAVFLAQARGRDRALSSGMMLLSFSLLLLITLLTGTDGV